MMHHFGSLLLMPRLCRRLGNDDARGQKEDWRCLAYIALERCIKPSLHICNIYIYI